MKTITAMACWLILLSGCGSPSEPSTVESGEIVAVARGLWSGDPAGPLQIHVKFEANDPCGIYFRVDDETRVRDARRGPALSAQKAVLEVGARVEVEYFVVAESCPGQSHAHAVTRLR